MALDCIWLGLDGLGPFGRVEMCIRADERIGEKFDVSVTTELNSFFRLKKYK
jgi:hypothetical protein